MKRLTFLLVLICCCISIQASMPKLIDMIKNTTWNRLTNTIVYCDNYSLRSVGKNKINLKIKGAYDRNEYENLRKKLLKEFKSVIFVYDGTLMIFLDY